MGKGHRTFIIAEIGVNHNGSYELAVKMIQEAKDAGVDAVKFQLFKTEDLASEFATLANYQKKATSAKNQKELLKNLELTKQEFIKLKQYCDSINIMFLATPFDLKSAKFLKQMNVAVYKVGSGDLTNYPLLKELALDDKPIILSTGMSTMDEINAAISYMYSINKEKKIALLQCTSSYPAPDSQLHLNVIKTYQQQYSIPIGYSDHSVGIEVPIAVTAMGANLIEKHFTLDKKLPGPDHSSSLTPEELNNMIIAIRRIETALGDANKQVTKNEKELRIKARKGIFIMRNLEQGATIMEDDLVYLRPEMGISASDFESVIGRKLISKKKKGAPLYWTDLE
ncbi:N-acetylneuraminate synthase [Bacillus cereus]|nr:N-acetylneuraminate synthase [Bacillus cereus]